MFVQPWMLYALPLMALPVIIHLINQRRFQTVEWAAMRFLLLANRMSRGYARIRQWLILAARTLAVAGLIFAMSRPMASGWLSVAAGSRVDTTIILLDRSPSMSQRSTDGGRTKLESAVEQLTRTLAQLPSDRLVLIDSGTLQPLELEGVEALSRSPQTSPVSASADWPAMLQATYDYIRLNQPGRTEIWLASDLRQADWDADSGRWEVLRQSFQSLPVPLRFHLLAYPQLEPSNRTLRVADVRRVEQGGAVELLLSLQIDQAEPLAQRETIPLQLELEGAVSTIEVGLNSAGGELRNLTVPLESRAERGWGRISLPADVNQADNEFYFVFDQPVARRTLLVAEDSAAVRPLENAAVISGNPAAPAAVEVRSPDQLTGVDWDELALVLWQGPLPTGRVAEELLRLAQRGGRIVCFPPQQPDETELAGLRWTGWSSAESVPVPIASWRGDQDLLSNTRSGAALPVGSLTVRRTCGLEGEFLPLATLQGGDPLLARAMTTERSIYYCTTTVAPGDSSLATDGVVLYVMIQRALAAGAGSLGRTRGLVAGRQSGAVSLAEWQPLTQTESLSSEYDLQAGVYAADQRLFAVNRSEREDRLAILSDAQVEGLFRGLPFDRIDGQLGVGTSLIQEIWRLFLMLMLAALLLEGILCIPRPRPPADSSRVADWNTGTAPGAEPISANRAVTGSAVTAADNSRSTEVTA